MAACIVLGCASAGPVQAASLELRAGASLVGGAASNPWLQPGPQRAEPLLLAIPRLDARWRLGPVELSGHYLFSLQQYVASGLTGWSHDLRSDLGWKLASRLRLEGLGGMVFTGYDAAGPTGETATLPLVAAYSRAFQGGLGLVWEPGRVSFRGGWLGTVRRSRAVLAGGAAAGTVDELMQDATLEVRWAPTRASRLTLGPVMEMRSASVEHLSYRGFGAILSSRLLPWSGGGVEVGLRVQANRFFGLAARDDLFARLQVGVWHRPAAFIRVGLRYAYTANGSALAAYDAERHLGLLIVDLWSPALEW